MAANSKSTSAMQEIQVHRDGFVLTLHCKRDVADMLLSPTIDPSIKELLVNGLLDTVDKKSQINPSPPVAPQASTSAPQASKSAPQASAPQASKTAPHKSTSAPQASAPQASAPQASSPQKFTSAPQASAPQASSPQASTSAPQASKSAPQASTSAPQASKSDPQASTSAPQTSKYAPQVSKSQLEESLTHGLTKHHGVIHQWTANQEDMLVSIRHERATDFLKNKNHAVLWKEIATRLNDEFGCNINAQQAINKYNNLKKRWKEVIDSKSGTETKYFRQRDAFDEAYGTRASTKPSFVIDSGSKVMCAEDKQEDATSDDNGQTNVANVVTNVAKNKKKTPKKKTPKRKSTELIELIKEQESDFKERMEQYHRDKMSRMDRLLDLYERDINTKTKNTGDPSAKD